MTFSLDVRDLLILGPNSSSTQSLRVHRCILKARAPLLYEELRNRWQPESSYNADELVPPNSPPRENDTSSSSSVFLATEGMMPTRFQVKLRDDLDWLAFRNVIQYLYLDTVPQSNQFSAGRSSNFTQSTTTTTTSTTTGTSPPATPATTFTGLRNGAPSDEYFDLLGNMRDIGRRYQIDRLEKLCAFKMGELVEVPDCHLGVNLRSIFNRDDDDTVDVRLRINGGRLMIPAHKAILIARCPYFRGMFQSGMIESGKDEVDIPEETTEKAFLQLMEYLYCDEIRELDGETAMEVYALANRYALDHLQNYCMTVICDSVDESNIEEVKKWADTFGNSNLRFYCEHRIRGGGTASNNHETEASNR